MDHYQTLVEKAKKGFRTLDTPDTLADAALDGLQTWLGDEMFAAYVPQIEHLIKSGQWDFLLDSFYQVIPFGTGGRRGPVGIGPNRINPWTIQASAQGHSQYLIQTHGESARQRGVVLAYDVRCFTDTRYYAANRPNPVANLDGRQLAEAAARVYAANGIRVYLFDGARSTPELSFAIRHLNAIAGCVFSASHNLPTDNGKKVYDQFGGQLIAPHDQNLVDEVTGNVSTIDTLDFDAAAEKGLLSMIGAEVDTAYHQAVSDLNLSDARGIRILYSPLHGTGLTSVYPVLKRMGFDIHLDPATANPSGAFENVTFNIPNPEVIQSFDTALPNADAIGADVIMSTDPDADRIGIMVRHNDRWTFVNGNEIGIVLSEWAIDRFRENGRLTANSVIIKTDVTASLIDTISAENGIQCIGDLLVGFKYIGEEMNRLEAAGRQADFILGTEESHGYIMGNYVRDKDAAGAAVWLAELASGLKAEGRTLVDYLDAVYAKYGYCHNYLTEIRLLGAKGIGQIAGIMSHLRESTIDRIGDFAVMEKIDRWQGDPQPHLSPTDTASRNVLILKLKPLTGTRGIRVTVRPSGTEPKFKIYIEVLGRPFDPADRDAVKSSIANIRERLERAFMGHCYHILGVDFPERGFLLFWQLPLDDKLKYFTLEDRLAGLTAVADPNERQSQMDALLAFLGANPVQKVDQAFAARFGTRVLDYLGLA
ncbi:phospho-sugar mutase [Desulfosarcina ovata]|uniref:Phosphomannomutase n=1 Tax=Desulfosarcina ovata subsp. ovata TaxID=2752305 RepID=A0A5K8AF38_9BACT|nr:phospho-sugar mutase [Desulfosarcina ovata]BBO91323.1 phosphomannomutase [Desulfosarcina ovata subsp. ovata]